MQDSPVAAELDLGAKDNWEGRQCRSEALLEGWGVLLHEHPAQRVSDCMRLIVNLVSRGRKIDQTVWPFQLDSEHRVGRM